MNAKCKKNQIEMLDKLDQLDCLKNCNKLQREEINKINTENEALKEKLDTQNKRHKTDTEQLQEQVNLAQNQVAALLKEHDEKTAQFQVTTPYRRKQRDANATEHFRAWPKNWTIFEQASLKTTTI